MAIKNSRKKGVARLWELACHKRIFIILSGFFAVLSAITLYFPVITVYFIIKELLPALNHLSQINQGLVMSYGWWAVGGALCSLVFNFLSLLFSHLAAFQTLYDLKITFTTYLASLPLGFFTDHPTGQLRKIVDENIERIEGFIAHQVPDIISSVVTPIIILFILFFVDWRFGLATLVPLLFAYTIQMYAYFKPEAMKAMDEYQDALEDMNHAAVEYVRGISVVKIFNQTIYSFRHFYQTIDNYSRWAMNYTNKWVGVMSFFLIMTNFVYVFIVPFIILKLTSQGQLVDFIAIALFYLFFSASVSSPFMKLMNISYNMRKIASEVERMDMILNQQPLPQPKNSASIHSHDIIFKDVSFTYQHRDEAAIKHLSFKAKTGEITALVGPSGSGKSTIAHLIPRFYDVDQGAILIGDTDIRQIASDQLMDQVSFVFQDVFLFKLSIVDNLRIAKKDASMEEIIAACQAAQCHEFILKLKDGYKTVIGTQGIHLSGGEKQRLIIARAILKNAPILVLDEATAFADPENEDKIQQAFKALMKDKTVIMIAHRLSTIQGAHQILVLDQGQIKEQGTHQELLKRAGQYAKMWEQYTQALGWSIQSKEVA